MPIVIVTGPSRSGKSEWAEHRAVEAGRAVTYVATAQENPDDTEWQNRILRHQMRRPEHWKTLHVPFELLPVIQTQPASACVLIDSLGTWVANAIEDEDSIWGDRVEGLLQGLHRTTATVILVAEETGWGVVPSYPLGRRFRDRLGHLTRQISGFADEVYLVCAGFAINLKEVGIPVPNS